MGMGGGRYTGDSLGAGLKNIQWDLSRLPVFEKNFYIEHPAVSARTDAQAEDWRQSRSITVIGRGIPKVSHIILYHIRHPFVSVCNLFSSSFLRSIDNGLLLSACAACDDFRGSFDA
jgi:hypothetical protein